MKQCTLSHLPSVAALFLCHLLLFASYAPAVSPLPLWDGDMVRIARLDELSKQLRADIDEFASARRESRHISSSEHERLDSLMGRYSVIQEELKELRESWNSTCSAANLSCAKRTALSLAAEAISFENGAKLVESFGSTIWPRRINRGPRHGGDSYEKGLYDEELSRLYSSKRRKNCIEDIERLSKDRAGLYSLLSMPDAELRALVGIITSSEELGEFRWQSGTSRNLRMLVSKTAVFGAHVRGFFSGMFGRISKVFGNAAGAVKFGEPRIRGKLRERVRRELISVLQPGDIILDKVRLALTDRFIPGHFGHAAIWLGTTEELQRRGFIDMGQSEVLEDDGSVGFGGLAQVGFEESSSNGKWMKDLAAGRSVLEALRSGVQLNTLEHFLAVDEVLVLRLDDDHIPSDRESLLDFIWMRGMPHLGKDYDFNFDLNSPQEIFCSELVYLIYSDIVPWFEELGKDVKRLSPTDIALLSGKEENKPFEVVYYFCKGQSFGSTEAEEILEETLRED